jgi:hypothetical protein
MSKSNRNNSGQGREQRSYSSNPTPEELEMAQEQIQGEDLAADEVDDIQPEDSQEDLSDADRIDELRQVIQSEDDEFQPLADLHTKVYPNYLAYLADLAISETYSPEINSPEHAIIEQLTNTMEYAQKHSANSAWSIYSLFSTRGTTRKKAIEEAINVLHKTDNLKDAVGVITTLFNLLKNTKASFKKNSFEYIFIQELSAPGKPAGGLRGSFSHMFADVNSTAEVRKGLLLLSADELRKFKGYDITARNAVPVLAAGGPSVREEYINKTLVKLNDIVISLASQSRTNSASR